MGMQADEYVQFERAGYFGRCAVMMTRALQEETGTDPFSAVTSVDLSAATEPGHEGIFDQALTNGLAAIVAAEWPGAEAKNSRVHSARDLLKVIAEKIPEDGSSGKHVIQDRERPVRLPAGREGTIFDVPQVDSRTWTTCIDVRLLTDALDVSQMARHGSGEGGLQRRHVDALLALDDHPSLRNLSEARADHVGERAREEDGRSAAQARALLELIGDAEAERRAASAENPNEYHPKHNPDGHDFEKCPVCDYETFCVLGLDMWGRTGFGQCVVCSYQRSLQIADLEGFSEHLAWLIEKD